MVGGIDLSTRAVDLVALDEDAIDRADHLRVPLPHDWWDGARTMRETLLDHGVTGWLYDRNVRLVGVEKPYSTPQQIGTACKLYAILGAVVASLPKDITVFAVTPGQMRIELGLSGRAKKHEMHDMVRWWGVGDGWPPDALDGWAAAYACMRINERGTPVPGR